MIFMTDDVDLERLESLVTSQIPEDVIKKFKIDIATSVKNYKINEDNEIVVTIPGHCWFSYDSVTYTPISGGGGGGS